MIAEDVLLLLLDDTSGSPSTDPTTLDYGLAGALLVELSLAERLQIGEASFLHKATVTVTDPSPTGNEVLDDALARIAAKPVNAERLVRDLSKDLRARLLERLVGRGVLREERGTVLGIFPRRRWPAVDPTHEDGLRRRLRDVLVTGAPPDPAAAALVGVLASMHQADKVLQETDRSVRKQARQRAEVIAQGDWASAAVRRAIQASQDATTAAVVAASVAATVAST